MSASNFGHSTFQIKAIHSSEKLNMDEMPHKRCLQLNEPCKKLIFEEDERNDSFFYVQKWAPSNLLTIKENL